MCCLTAGSPIIPRDSLNVDHQVFRQVQQAFLDHDPSLQPADVPTAQNSNKHFRASRDKAL